MFKKYFTAYRRPFCLAIACVALEAVCDLMGPTIMARILDEGVRAGDLSRVGFWGAVMLLVTAAGAVFALILLVPNVLLLMLMRKYVGPETLSKGFKM